jgi:hypothetical protein
LYNITYIRPPYQNTTIQTTNPHYCRAALHFGRLFHKLIRGQLEDGSSAKTPLKLSKSAKTLKEFYPIVIRLQLAFLFGKIWEEFSHENVIKAFKVNQYYHKI